MTADPGECAYCGSHNVHRVSDGILCSDCGRKYDESEHS